MFNAHQGYYHHHYRPLNRNLISRRLQWRRVIIRIDLADHGPVRITNKWTHRRSQYNNMDIDILHYYYYD
jgi:hypothetical protein